jgi:hypothetical protein
MKLNRTIQSLAKTLLVVPVGVLFGTLAIIPKMFVGSSARAQGACSHPSCGTPGTSACEFPCPPCSGPTSGPFTCGS